MRTTEARHESDMAKMAASLKAVTDALLSMKASIPASPAPVAPPTSAASRQTEAALQAMASQLAALTTRMQSPAVAPATPSTRKPRPPPGFPPHATAPATQAGTNDAKPMSAARAAARARDALKISDPAQWQLNEDAFWASAAGIAQRAKSQERRRLRKRKATD